MLTNTHRKLPRKPVTFRFDFGIFFSDWLLRLNPVKGLSLCNKRDRTIKVDWGVTRVESLSPYITSDIFILTVILSKNFVRHVQGVTKARLADSEGLWSEPRPSNYTVRVPVWCWASWWSVAGLSCSKNPSDVRLIVPISSHFLPF